MIVIEKLREMTPADRQALCRTLQDSEVMYAYNGPFSDEEVDEWLERQLARYRQYGYGLWAVVLKATGEMIAASACMDYAFGTLNSPIVCSIIRDNNLPSQQVALRNGMTRRHGVMVKHYRGAGMPHWLFVRPRTIRTVRYQSPCGEMLLGAAGDRLCLCNWAQELHPGRVEQRLRTILKAQFEECGHQGTIRGVRADNGDRRKPVQAIRWRCPGTMPDIHARGPAADRPGTGRILPRRAQGLRHPPPAGRLRLPEARLAAAPPHPLRADRLLRRQTASYGELAAAIGSPRSVRAVANANGANAISIILPCHRVIGSDGRLTGYGGGLRAKQYLLDLEQRK